VFGVVRTVAVPAPRRFELTVELLLDELPQLCRRPEGVVLIVTGLGEAFVERLDPRPMFAGDSTRYLQSEDRVPAPCTVGS
jgi:hypothetical protein